eukprot:gene3546-3412_t
MRLKQRKCGWIHWPATLGEKRVSRPTQDTEDQEWIIGGVPKKCIECGKTAVKLSGVPRSDPSRTNPDVRPQKYRIMCKDDTCNKTWTVEVNWTRNKKYKGPAKPVLPEPVLLHGQQLPPTTGSFKLLGIEFDRVEPTMHTKRALKDLVDKMDRVHHLPKMPAETVAKLVGYSTTRVTYGALAYSMDGMLSTLDNVQTKIDAAVRRRAGRSVCKEILYDDCKNGGIGVPYLRTQVEFARISTFLRMWNAVHNISSKVARWSAVSIAREVRLEDYKIKKYETLVERTENIFTRGTGVKRSDRMLVIAGDLRRWGVKIRVQQPENKNDAYWKPAPEEYHPQVRALARAVTAKTGMNMEIKIGSDGGLTKQFRQPTYMTSAVAVTMKDSAGLVHKAQAGFRITGNPTSYHAEKVAMEAMLYVGWRIHQKTGMNIITYISDSKPSVDRTNDIKNGGKVTKGDTTPTRSCRMAELLKRSGGTLKWIKGHQDVKEDVEIELNNRADREATKAKRDAQWDTLEWDGRRPLRYQQPATLVGEDIECERKPGRMLRERFYEKLHKDIQSHPGLPAAAAVAREENRAMLKVRFYGILARGGERRDLLRNCRGGGWGDFRTRKNGKCIRCGKEPPTMTHCLTRCTKQKEVYNERAEEELERAGITKDNRARIKKLLSKQKTRLNTMLGILPEEYFDVQKGTRAERWIQGAKAAEVLADRATELLYEYRTRAWEQSNTMTDEQMGWYQSTRATGYE